MSFKNISRTVIVNERNDFSSRKMTVFYRRKRFRIKD